VQPREINPSSDNTPYAGPHGTFPSSPQAREGERMDPMRRREALHLLCLVSLAHRREQIGSWDASSPSPTATILTTDQGRYRVRLAGIDTPEKRQPFGRVAKDHLSSLVNGQTVTVNYYKRDHYGRIVDKVLTSGTDASLRQVEAGLAWHYKRYEQEQSDWDRAAYARAEGASPRGETGLWRDPEPVSPWELPATAVKENLATAPLADNRSREHQVSIWARSPVAEPARCLCRRPSRLRPCQRTHRSSGRGEQHGSECAAQKQLSPRCAYEERVYPPVHVEGFPIKGVYAATRRHGRRYPERLSH
jgi:endonuclease YncB( thermonuclease family)